MKLISRFTVLIAIAICIAAGVARADSYEYTLTQQGVSTPIATWTMPSEPSTASCMGGTLTPCYAAGEFFGLDTNVYLNGSSTPTADTLLFFNTAFTSSPYVLFNDANGLLPDVDTLDVTQMLYTMASGVPGCTSAEQCPEMIIPPGGSFTLTNDQADVTYILSVVDLSAGVPEPSTIWMLGLGLMALMLFVRRQQIARWMIGNTSAAS